MALPHLKWRCVGDVDRISLRSLHNRRFGGAQAGLGARDTQGKEKEIFFGYFFPFPPLASPRARAPKPASAPQMTPVVQATLSSYFYIIQ